MQKPVLSKFYEIISNQTVCFVELKVESKVLFTNGGITSLIT